MELYTDNRSQCLKRSIDILFTLDNTVNITAKIHKKLTQ